ncbi:hypothetical protein bcgnr5378_66600 [Bacillus cereus]
MARGCGGIPRIAYPYKEKENNNGRKNCGFVGTMARTSRLHKSSF